MAYNLKIFELSRPLPRSYYKRAGAISLACLLSYCSANAQLFITREFESQGQIPDFGEFLDSRTWAFGNAPIDEVRVRLDISGQAGSQAYNGDLYVALSYNESLSVLLNHPGRTAQSDLGYSDNGFSIWLQDSAAMGDVHVYRQTLFGDPLTSLEGPLTGTWSSDGRLVDPDQVLDTDNRTALLNVFQGFQSGADWNLFVADLSPGAAHVLNSWALELAITGPFIGGITLNTETLHAGLNLPAIPNNLNIAGPVTFDGLNPIIFSGPVTLSGTQTLEVNNITSFSGIISETNAPSILIKTGTGTLDLSGANDFTGGVLVMAGVLSVNNSDGSATGSGLLTLSANTTLAGSGNISGPVYFEAGSLLAPGNSPGTLNLGSTTFEAGFSYDVEFNRVTDGQGTDPGWDWVQINGEATLLGTPENPIRVFLYSLSLDNTPGPVSDFNPALNYSWTILSASGGILGFDENSIQLIPSFFLNADPNLFTITSDGNNLNVLYIVPEPSKLSIFLASLLLLFSTNLGLIRTNKINDKAKLAH